MKIKSICKEKKEWIRNSGGDEKRDDEPKWRRGWEEVGRKKSTQEKMEENEKIKAVQRIHWGKKTVEGEPSS